VNTGTGGIQLTLPAAEQPYQANITVGTGSGTVEIEAGAAVELIASSGTGGFTVDVPADAAVRVEASTGTGDINVPANFERQDDQNNFIGDNGVWETANFAEADRQIVIKYSGGTGDLKIQ
jgi:predicted membrane protein